MCEWLCISGQVSTLKNEIDVCHRPIWGHLHNYKFTFRCSAERVFGTTKLLFGPDHSNAQML